ncbi:hypothetical protein O2W15_18465 [Modestobacter sp. VKM Ac-2979]|uniref:hypothetical protein n=1 Tax=unclassified Modestobacter TaxID=2643866 RepID=UPI0022ABB7D6|nr:MULTISPECIES: hypothetical protein [unclassified Modestobacter]MCZ2813419.1 hypothetical protein [Modestobacter sp. VKM Ac-2979]MCZ2842389.1 hypothetical protein [Modestobacter sp. VKM Ac-2980]
MSIKGKLIGSASAASATSSDVQADLSGYAGGQRLIVTFSDDHSSWAVRRWIRLTPPPIPSQEAAPVTTAPSSSPDTLVNPPQSSETTDAGGPQETSASAPAPTDAPDEPANAESTTSPAGDANESPSLSSPSSTPPSGNNTGPRSGAVLHPSGPLVLSTPGQVVSNLDVDGCVTVLASDVTIRDVRIRCADAASNRAVFVANDVRNLLIEDTEIDGLGSTHIGIGWSNYTLRRVNIHGTCDGARISTNIQISNSWIHDLVRMDGLHCDALQTTEGSEISVHNNLLDPRNTLGTDLNNSAVMLGTETGTRRLENAVFSDNWLSGGNFSVNVRKDANLTNVAFRRNIYMGSARYGPAIAPAAVTFEDNVMLDGALWKIVPPW